MYSRGTTSASREPTTLRAASAPIPRNCPTTTWRGPIRRVGEEHHQLEDVVDVRGHEQGGGDADDDEEVDHDARRSISRGCARTFAAIER